jgi:uncharacterized membrane protein
MTANTELMSEAKQSLQGNWVIAIGVMLVYLIVAAASGFIPLGSLVLGGPLALGYIIFNKKIACGEEPKIENLFDGFKNFLPALATYLLAAVFICLWLLLLIIPGLIMALAYSQAMYILSDEPEIGAYDAIKKSRAMMDGYKMKLFGMMLLFMLLSLLCLLTLGIGYLFLIPFVQVTMVKFYQDVKADYDAMQPPAEPILETEV